MRPLRALVAAALALAAPGLAPYEALALQAAARSGFSRAPVPVALPRLSVTRGLTVPTAGRWGQTSNLSPATDLMSGTVLVAPTLAAAPQARVQLESARPLLEQPFSLSLWDGFWHGGRARPVETSVAGKRNTLTRTLSRARERAKKATNSALLAAPLAAVSAPGWVETIWDQLKQYAPAALTLLATYVVVRLARAVITKLAKKYRWDAQLTVSARLLATIALWAGGLALALHLAGASMVAVYSTLAVGGIVLLPTIKDVLGNLMEGVKVLVGRPFVVGDKVQIGGKRYVIKDMGLRHLHLQGTEPGLTYMTYAKAAKGPVTVFRPYESSRSISPRPGRTLRGAARLLKEAAAPSLRRSALWTLAGVALLVGLPLLKNALSLAAFDAVFPYLEGASALWVTRSVARWAGGLVERVGTKNKWEPQALTLAKLGVTSAVWIVGGGLALGAFGVGWSTVLASLGIVPAAIAIASTDIVGNLVQGFLLLLQRPFVVGDVIASEGVTGAVADMSLQYIVLKHSDGAHSLVPHSVVRDDPFTVLSPEQAAGADTSAPKPKEK